MFWLELATAVVFFIIAGRLAGRPDRALRQWNGRGRHE